ncbi:MAG: deoxyribose-phosphate aldolase [Bacteroidota bacterium]|nr:deoxyribose-phosphate aldolase [Bacteroidota bacterium]
MKIKIEDFLESTYLKTELESGVSNDEHRNIIEKVIKEAIKYKFILVMLRPQFITFAKKIIYESNSEIFTGTVVDFPLGDSSTVQKIKEAKKSISLGVNDLDFVADYNSFKAQIFDKFDNDIIKCTEVGLKNYNNVKWIIETGALSKLEIRKISTRINNLIEKEFRKDASKIYIKTSTGYYGGFGATIQDVKTIKSSINNLKIKASGGISTLDQTYKMINAGASRIGTSKALDIIKQNHNNVI